MTRQLDLDFLEATALRRTRRGGVARCDGQWLYRGRPMPGGVLLELFEVLAEDGLLQVADPDTYGLWRVSLSDTGEHRYRELCQAQPTALPTALPVRVGRRSEQITGRERDRIAARLRRRYLAGATIRDLVGETGRSFGWVRTLLVEAGVELRGRGGARPASAPRRKDITVQRVVQLHHGGLSRTQIAARLGCSEGVVQRRLIAAGLGRPR